MGVQRADGSGETPIDVAAKYKHGAAVQLLRDALQWPQLAVAKPSSKPGGRLVAYETKGCRP